MKTFKKHLSQNFLIDENIKKNIFKIIKIKKTDYIIEIGSGNGALSYYISDLSNKVILIEIDKSLVEDLKNNIKKSSTTIYNDDILKFKFKDIIKSRKKIRIIGNLPYKISTKIIFTLMEIKKYIKDIHFILQKDLVERITTKKKFSNVLSLLICYNFNIKEFFTINESSFRPKPKVKSKFIKFIPKKHNKILLNNEIFKETIKLFFKNKRKKIKGLSIIKKFEKYLNLEKRADDLKLNEYIRICNLISINKND